MATTGRRAEYAEATRQAITEAARTLFAEQGYFATKVDQIAERARVAAGTVYVAGGKQGLLRLLVDEWTSTPVKQQSIDRLKELDDPEQILQLLADATRSVRQEHLDTVRILLATAPNEPVAAEGLRLTTPHVRDSLVLVATRLDELGALRDGLTVERATDVLWFYFGYHGYLVLIDSGWSFEEAAGWLRDQSVHALLRS